jgi:uncharacterized coiled-coil DUF342 family protein
MEKRTEYIEKLKHKLDEWNAEIDVLEARLKEIQTDKKWKYAEKIQDLKEKRDDMQHKLAELYKTSDQAWAELKVGLDQAWQVLREALQKARSHFNSHDK